MNKKALSIIGAVIVIVAAIILLSSGEKNLSAPGGDAQPKVNVLQNQTLPAQSTSSKPAAPAKTGPVGDAQRPVR